MTPNLPTAHPTAPHREPQRKPAVPFSTALAITSPQRRHAGAHRTSLPSLTHDLNPRFTTRKRATQLGTDRITTSCFRVAGYSGRRLAFLSQSPSLGELSVLYWGGAAGVGVPGLGQGRLQGSHPHPHPQLQAAQQCVHLARSLRISFQIHCERTHVISAKLPCT